MQIHPQRSYSAEFDDSPSYDVYDSNGETSDVESQQYQLWEAVQKEEAHHEVIKEAPVYDSHPSLGKQVQEPSPIYDLDDSKEYKTIANFQRDLLTNKWGEGFQQQFFQEEPKVEGPSSVCGCMFHKYSCREAVQERETTTIFFFSVI